MAVIPFERGEKTPHGPPNSTWEAIVREAFAAQRRALVLTTLSVIAVSSIAVSSLLALQEALRLLEEKYR